MTRNLEHHIKSIRKSLSSSRSTRNKSFLHVLRTKRMVVGGHLKYADTCATIIAVTRHVALNLIKTEKTAKVGIKTKRLMAGWDSEYLLKITGLI